MKSLKTFILESVNYTPDNSENRARIADSEHNETTHQSEDLQKNKDFRSGVHPAIRKAIHGFAKDKESFHKSMQSSKVEKLKKGTNVGNSEFGQGAKSVEDPQKRKRVRGMIRSGAQIDRPIVLRHTDKEGNQHHHLLAGNTRATTIGHGVETHIIDV